LISLPENYGLNGNLTASMAGIRIFILKVDTSKSDLVSVARFIADCFDHFQVWSGGDSSTLETDVNVSLWCTDIAP
jgi:hypothetical protein